MPAARTKTTRTPTERKPTFSPTKLNTYLDCALKYRYVYIDKIGRFYLKSKSYYSFGTTLHHVLQDFHGQGGTQSVEEMQTTLGTAWVGAGYETDAQEKEHKERGEEIVTRIPHGASGASHGAGRNDGDGKNPHLRYGRVQVIGACGQN